ncbi:MFS transporter [Nocardia panacis]|uniref:MFS transporter n=1 Tax=Nocardia panacis TaxID=2340916 RepID=A0A3A4JR90_9NOCA|nr:MFS transporter [Nocardia panacis]RJO72029.1 MFS transporter [Nocardia panacis]
MGGYREVLRSPGLRNVLVLGALVRIPFAAGVLLIALHVVQTLHGSYAQAGAMGTVMTVCRAVSGPWRGRLLDRFGLRRTLAPSLVVGTVCWGVAPFVSYWPLLVLVAVAGIFDLPIFAVVRQAVIAAAGASNRQSALALESVSVEVAFMVGPVVGIAATTAGSTTYVLLAVQMCLMLSGLVIFVLNPPLRSDDSTVARKVPRREWFHTEFIALCVCACASVTVLGATELAFVSAIRGYGAQQWLGVVLAVWAFGSLVGGLIYGLLPRAPSTYPLLTVLGFATIPLVFGGGPLLIGVGGFIAGLFCAPTLTACLSQLSRIVPEGGRGEAIGWHSAALTLGSGIGSSFAGVAIDAGGFRAGFGAAALIGIVCGLGLGAMVAMVGRRRPARVREVTPAS